jgi:hypothetical protein
MLLLKLLLLDDLELLGSMGPWEFVSIPWTGTFCLFMSMERDYVSELRPPTGLLFSPQVIYEYGQPRWNDADREKPEELGEKTVLASF